MITFIVLDTLNLSRDALADLLTHANRSLSGKIFWTTNDGSLSRAVEVKKAIDHSRVVMSFTVHYFATLNFGYNNHSLQ